ncbi:hypothetical protein FGW37_05120 [Streptomyces rectiverticillatus]|nr:hypothetical protein FGW37_05120 [Streptomyces rectiverticillatus]
MSPTVPRSGRRARPGCAEKAAEGGGRGVGRMGARRPSGRPGTRWLRVDREPLSTERPGPTRVAPAGPAAPPSPPCAGTWLPVAVAAPRRTAPMAQLRSTTVWKCTGRTSCGGLRRTYRPSPAPCQHLCDLEICTKSAGQYGE